MAKSRIGNTQLISTLNNRLILHAVRVMQPTFRAEVARKTGLKPATVTSIVNDLIEQQLLREVPGEVDHSARFGRPPLMLELNSDSRHILAIDLEPDRIRVAITDLIGRILHYQEQGINRFDQPDAVVAQIAALGKSAINTLGKKPLEGVGMSLPGLIDTQKGILLSSTNMPRWKNVPVAAMLEKEFQKPVTVERSIHLAAIYEKWSHPHVQDKTVVMISLRTGIGMSLLQKGQLYAGASGLSGEIGHNIVDINGKPCECGSRGCLETFVGAPAIVERAKALMTSGAGKALRDQVDQGQPLTPELIYRLAADGDKECVAIVRDVGRYMGIAISNIINLLAPDEVVICGAIDVVEDLLLTAIREQVNISALPRSREHVTIRVAVEKEKLPLLGAAVLIAQELFDLPELRHADVEAIETTA
jgi:predicted NBD/HSP70 family sugar kinase